MAINATLIAANITEGEVYIDADVPASNVNMTHTNGRPDGYNTRYLGAIDGPIKVDVGSTIEGMPIEQSLGLIAPHVVTEAASMEFTLLEPNLKNLELVLPGGKVVNLLGDYNPSFELDSNADGTADFWNVSGAATRIITTDPQTAYGAKSQQFTTSGALPGGIVSDAVSHPIYIKPGKIMVFTAYAKAAAATPTAQLKIEAFSALAATLGSQTASHVLSTLFTRGSVAYTLPANTAYVKVSYTDATGSDVTVKVDNVQLEVVGSGSTATGFVGPGTLFLGDGNLAVPTRSIVVIWRKSQITDAYAWVQFYTAFPMGELKRSYQKGQTVGAKLPIKFLGMPDLNRATNDQLLQWCEEQAS